MAGQVTDKLAGVEVARINNMVKTLEVYIVSVYETIVSEKNTVVMLCCTEDLRFCTVQAPEGVYNTGEIIKFSYDPNEIAMIDISMSIEKFKALKIK